METGLLLLCPEVGTVLVARVPSLRKGLKYKCKNLHAHYRLRGIDKMQSIPLTR